MFCLCCHLMLSDLRSDNDSFSHYRNPANIDENMVLFHILSTTIGLIANLKAGSERAAKPAQSVYSSCHDTLRSHIVNSSANGSNCKMQPRYRYKPAKILRFDVQSS